MNSVKPPVNGVTLGDIHVNYRTAGSGPAVVLLHGLAEDHASWNPVLEHLGNFTVFAVDLRGHGATPAGAGRGSLEQLGDDLVGFLREVSGPARVVGYSLGGTIALEAATRPDAAVEGVIAVATSSVVGRACRRLLRRSHLADRLRAIGRPSRKGCAPTRPVRS